MLENFKLRALQKALQLNHNIVIAMSFNHATKGGERHKVIISPSLSFLLHSKELLVLSIFTHSI